MFFSPLQLSSRTKAKKEALPPKSKHLIISQRGTGLIPQKNSGKISGKAWEILRSLGKYWESMGNPGKAWETRRKHWISRVSMGNPRKAWKILRNLGKAQAIPAKAVKSWEMLLKPNKCC